MKISQLKLPQRTLVTVAAMTVFSCYAFEQQETSHEKQVRRNFGVVVSNPSNGTFIYRSNGLGKDGLDDVQDLLKEQQLPFPKTIISMNDEGYQWTLLYRGPYVLQEYQLQSHPKYGGYKLYHAFGPEGERTYLDGQRPDQPVEDIDAKRLDKLNETSLALFGDRGPSERDGGMATYKKIVEMVLDPENQPVLFHCHGGKHRTGMVALTLRKLQGDKKLAEPQEVRGWPIQIETEAELEYFQFASGNLFYPPRYENLRFVRDMVKTAWFAEMRSKYQDQLRGH